MVPLGFVLCLTVFTTPIRVYAQGFTFEGSTTPGADDTSSKFGWSMDQEGEWVVIGAPHFSGSGIPQAGRAFVAPINALYDVTQHQDLMDIADSAHQRFGGAVTIAGEFIAVSNCSAYGTGQYCGVEYAPWVTLFRQSGMWQWHKRIYDPFGGPNTTFGTAIAMNEDWLAVGGSKVDLGEGLENVVCLYQRNAGGADNWGLVDTISSTHEPGIADDQFGLALDIVGEVLIIGAPGDDELGIDCGAAYVFRKDLGGSEEWGSVRKLLPSEGVSGNRFGASISIAMDRAVIGAPKRSVGGTTAGGVYVFARDLGGANNWGEECRLEPQTVVANMDFGAALAIADGRIIVGAPLADISANGTDGSVHLFVRNDLNGQWELAQQIVPWYDGVVSQVSRSSTALVLTDDKLIIGAPFASIDTPPPTGALLVYSGPVLGINGDPSPPDVLIFPNPFITSFRVQWSGPAVGSLMVLRDMRGRELRRVSIALTTNDVQVTREGLPSGIYLVELQHDPPDRSVTRKLVVAQ